MEGLGYGTGSTSRKGKGKTTVLDLSLGDDVVPSKLATTLARHSTRSALLDACMLSLAYLMANAYQHTELRENPRPHGNIDH